MAKAIHTMVRVLDEARSDRLLPAGVRPPRRRPATTSPTSPWSILRNAERPTTRSSSPSTRAAPSPTALGDGYGHAAFVRRPTSTPSTARFEAGLGLTETRRSVEMTIATAGLLARLLLPRTNPDGYKIEVAAAARPLPMAARSDHFKKQEDAPMATETMPAKGALSRRDSCNGRRAASRPQSSSLRPARCSTPPRPGRSTSRASSRRR